jgi:hypothetical protein
MMIDLDERELYTKYVNDFKNRIYDKNGAT